MYHLPVQGSCQQGAWSASQGLDARISGGRRTSSIELRRPTPRQEAQLPMASDGMPQSAESRKREEDAPERTCRRRVVALSSGPRGFPRQGNAERIGGIRSADATMLSERAKQSDGRAKAQDMSATLSWPAGQEVGCRRGCKFEALENEATHRPPSRDSAKLPKVVPWLQLPRHVWNFTCLLAKLMMHPRPSLHLSTPLSSMTVC